jgi:25S rRNA (uracil2843-N3)-methyltransferase
MGPKSRGTGGRAGKGAPKKADSKSNRTKKPPPQEKTQQHGIRENKQKKDDDDDDDDNNERGRRRTGTDDINLSARSAIIPLTLQQLLLNVFKYGLLFGNVNSSSSSLGREYEDKDKEEKEELDIRSLIQTIKSHLYNRDFDSAFTEANEQLLRAYALRWSASRVLGYAGILKAVLMRDGVLRSRRRRRKDDDGSRDAVHVLCIGGGAGAEIVALAGAWRDMLDSEEERLSGCDVKDMGDATRSLTAGAGAIALNYNDDDDDDAEEQDWAVGDAVEEKTQDTERKKDVELPPSRRRLLPNLSVTAVDIADWSSVVARLSQTIHSSDVPGSKAHPAPLLSPPTAAEKGERRKRTSSFEVSFKHLDILGLTDEELRSLLLPRRDQDHNDQPAAATDTVLITLMFTLNELFATSMAKTTQFLLRLTDLVAPGTILLVVDSPGSYSTVSLRGKKMSKENDEHDDNDAARHYPMKFLVHHTLLSVASGKWDLILSEDSRWFRRDAARLRYDVGGEGAARLEDMRYQIHVYRRLP